MIIRQAEIHDADFMSMIDLECFALPWSADAFRKEIGKNRIAFYAVAEENKQVIGYMGFWRIEDEAHITNVAVLPEYRRRKVGTGLIGAVLDFARSEGIKAYTLEVRAGNEPAKKLYQSFGFKSEGVRPKYYFDNDEDALIMWKRD